MMPAEPLHAREWLRERIYDSYQRTTASCGLSEMPLGELHSQMRRRWRHVLPDDHSLPTVDLGCGKGEFVLFLQSEGFAAVEGVDVSLEQVQLARSLGARNVVHGSALEYIAGQSERYGLVTAFNLLEHFDRVEILNLMDGVVAALRPEGRFIAMVPNSKGLFGAQVRFADLTHEMSFTPRSVMQLCEVVGLRLIDILENGPLPHGLFSSMRWVAWQAIRGCLLGARVAEGADWTWPVFTQDLFFVAEKPAHCP
jgi:2-polyprenyl-3-methyl-5-hydroxy-6-metoxy-1,4-benzoquinol methylase